MQPPQVTASEQVVQVEGQGKLLVGLARYAPGALVVHSTVEVKALKVQAEQRAII